MKIGLTRLILKMKYDDVSDQPTYFSIGYTVSIIQSIYFPLKYLNFIISDFSKAFDDVLFTLMHMQREIGMVARMRRRERRASRRAQHPGPSGSARK